MTQPPGPPAAGPGNPWATPPSRTTPPQPPAPVRQPPPSQPAAPQPPAPEPPGPVPAPPPGPQEQAPQPGWGPPQEREPPPPPVWLPPYEPPRRRRGLLVTVIVLVLLVLAGGAVGGVVLLHRPADGTGKASATDAAQAFLTAVYQTRDANAVAPLVCAAARDRKKIQAKIDEIVRQDKRYRNPRYAWTAPETQATAKDRAVVTTTVTLTTDDEQVAGQKLKLTVIHSTGWFVCDVQSSPAA